MSEPFKICPICGTPAHRNAAICSTCGATLANVEVHEAGGPRPRKSQTYDPRYGETDLFEGELRRKGQTFFLGIVLTVSLIACGALVFVLGPRIYDAVRGQYGSSPTATQTAVPTADLSNVIPLDTNTPRPTLNLATVTPAPPTATPSPTQGPCERKVKPGDDLISLAVSCGHRSLDVVDLIVTLNALSGPDSIQVGQTINIPWPTPTLDPSTLPTEEVGAQLAVTRTPDPNRTASAAEVALENSNAIATQTLQPGVQYHRVTAGENIMQIAFEYGANIEILSQLNPEITFSQCDFGSPSGGESCIVTVYQGQMVRVPAPTPTPTIQPTSNGSETPTPTPTPQFNAPVLRDPGNLALFRKGQIITLRWVTTGTLGKDEIYRVRAVDTAAGKVYSADTSDIFLIVPADWQATDAKRHDYQWSVSVIDRANPDTSKFTTETRTFSWEGRGATS